MFIHAEYCGASSLRVVDSATGDIIPYVRWANSGTNEVATLNHALMMRAGVVTEGVHRPAAGFRIVLRSGEEMEVLAESEPDADAWGTLRPSVTAMYAAKGMDAGGGDFSEPGDRKTAAWLGGKSVRNGAPA